MSFLQAATRQLVIVFHVVTDWLLIVLGLLMIVVAMRAVDVPVARYVVIGCGLVLCSVGFWFRRKRTREK